jgi:hypothetical protein
LLSKKKTIKLIFAAFCLAELRSKIVKVQWVWKMTSVWNPYQGRIQGGGLAKIGKNMIFWPKIVIFHMKYPKHYRASLRSEQFF